MMTLRDCKQKEELSREGILLIIIVKLKRMFDCKLAGPGIILLQISDIGFYLALSLSSSFPFLTVLSHSLLLF